MRFDPCLILAGAGGEREKLNLLDKSVILLVIRFGGTGEEALLDWTCRFGKMCYE